MCFMNLRLTRVSGEYAADGQGGAVADAADLGVTVVLDIVAIQAPAGPCQQSNAHVIWRGSARQGEGLALVQQFRDLQVFRRACRKQPRVQQHEYQQGSRTSTVTYQSESVQGSGEALD